VIGQRCSIGKEGTTVKIKNAEDFWAGLMFIGFGLAAVIVARDYPMGAAMRMGPGYFPTYIGAILTVIGAIIAARATVVPGEGLRGWGWRPLIALCFAFAAYGLIMDEFDLGFVPALIAVIALSSFAERGFRPLELALLIVVLVAGAVGLFIYGLELPYPLFWWN
jgi:hypothetical protein